MSTNQLPISVFDTPDELERAALDLVQSIVASASAETPVHIVLAGGSTPKRLYEKLAELDGIPWEHVHMWFGDERTVPPDHDDSNFKMCHESLLSSISIPAENIHRMRGEVHPEAAAQSYCDEIASHVPKRPSGMPRFDLVILGLGEDGHTASLFPNTEALDETSAFVVANEVPQEQTVRITMTTPVLDAAEHVLFLATGEAKAEALSAIVSAGKDGPPAGLVRPEPGELHWYVDRAAAHLLPDDQVSR
ncbi:6-phosphogluconolactonase [soil metagenome]